MPKLKEIFIQHKWVIVLAVLLSLITAFPQIYFRFEHRSDGVYQGIELLPDSPWSPRVREVMDGHPNFGAIYYKDGKDDPYLFQPLGSMAVAYEGELFGLDINNTILLSRFTFTFLVFILIYVFIYFLSKDKLISLAGASLLLLADSIQDFSGIKQLLEGISPDNFVRLARPVNPAMIYLLLFGFLIAFWIFYKKRTWQWGALSAVILGLNFYNYFYSWTYLFSFLGFLILIELIRKKWRDALHIALILLGSIIVAIPYILNLLSATKFPTYIEVSHRNGIVATHHPLFIGLFSLIALILFLWKFPKGENEDKEKYFFGLALLLAPIATMNQQILTGKVLQAGHYHWFFHKPMAVIFILLVIFYFLKDKKFEFYRKSFGIIIIIVSFSTGIFVQAKSYISDPRDGGQIAIQRQQYGPIMKWLSDNAPKESVVLSNDEISHLVSIYTPLNLFYHRAASYSLAATRERLLDTLFVFYRLRGIDAKNAHDVFFKERGDISTNIDGIYYREALGSYEAIPDAELEDIVSKYQGTLSTPTKQWLQSVLTKYEVSYVVWDKVTDPAWNLDQYTYLKKVAVFGDIAIYNFK